jgi:hypothetical protein
MIDARIVVASMQASAHRCNCWFTGSYHPSSNHTHHIVPGFEDTRPDNDPYYWHKRCLVTAARSRNRIDR